MIEFRNVSKSFKNDKVLSNLSFRVNDGDFLIIEGANGSGKTTIINLILNLIDLDDNFGEVINNFNSISYYPSVFTMPSLIKSYDFLYTYFFGIENKERIDYFIKKYNLENKLVCNLSKGNTLKIALIKTLIERSEVYIFDEPFNGLDEESKKLFVEDLTKMNKDGKTIIVVTHDKLYFKDMEVSTLKLGGDNE